MSIMKLTVIGYQLLNIRLLLLRSKCELFDNVISLPIARELVIMINNFELQLQLKTDMNKSHNFRKCSYCPHHSIMDIKKACCCQSRTSVQNKSKCKSKLKSKGKRAGINESTISYVNSTLPITNNENLPHFRSNVLAENSILRTENDLLKRELGNQYYPVSAFGKQERSISTFPGSENQTSRNQQIHDKLYMSNRNLQQALIELDNVSRTNKQLHELNTKLDMQKSQLAIRNEELLLEVDRLTKKNKKLIKRADKAVSEDELARVCQVNGQLEKDKAYLLSEVEQLRHQIEKMRSSKAEVECLSPEWVAHTSTKLHAIEKNISRLEEENKENSIVNVSIVQDKKAEEQMQLIKRQIISAIKSLKIKAQSFKFGVSAFDQIIQNSNPSILLLVKTLCECLFEPLQMTYMEMQRALDKKLKSYESKVHKIVKKMENMMIKLKNGRLRDRSRAKSTF